MKKKRKPPDLKFLKGTWKGLECSMCDGIANRKTVLYLPEKGGDHINQPYWMIQTMCKKCQRRNKIGITEKQLLEIDWNRRIK